MTNWLVWFGIYLLTGISLVLIVRFIAGWQRRHSSNDPELTADLLAIAKSLEPKKRIKDRALEIFAASLILLVWPVMPVALLIDECLKKRRARKGSENQMGIYDFGEKNEGDGKTTVENGCWPEHLMEVVDISTVPSQHIINDPLNRVPNLPFGFLNAAWNDFVGKVLPGDEVYRFLIPEDEPYGIHGFRADNDITGYAIKRSSIVVAQFIYEIECMK